MKLNRNFNQRKALIRTQLNALITSGQITTTQAKARLVKPLFDRLITKAKEGTLHARRQILSQLANISSTNRLVDTIAPLFPEKKSGFTSTKKVHIRKGDGVTLVSVKLLADLPLAKPKPASPEKAQPEKTAKKTSKK